MRLSTLNAPAIVLVVCVCGCDPPEKAPARTPGATTRQAQVVQPPPGISDTLTFASLDDQHGWTFSDGAEWPGATGSLQWRDNGGRSGDGALALSYNFEKGGHYVAAIAPLPQDRPVRAARLWVHKPMPNLMIFRAVDQDGEVFQKDLRYDYPGWQRLEVVLDEWTFSWGGDGEFRGPPREFHVLIENEGGPLSGTVLLDDVQWVYDTTTPTVGYQSATYVESNFAGVSDLHHLDRVPFSDPWVYAGAALGEFDRGIWSYEFDRDNRECRLMRDRGILGRPQVMRLTLDSDGGGHELKATFGSHFQLFERSLGKLEREGRITFEVPMGDMKTWRHFAGEDDGIVRYPLRLIGLTLVQRGAANNGQIVLRRLEFDTHYDPPGETISIVATLIETDMVGEYALQVDARSLATRPIDGVLRYSLHGTDTVVEQEEITFYVPPAGERKVWRTPIETDAPMIEARVRFFGESTVSPPASVTVATVPDAPGDHTLNPASRMGVGMYLYRFNDHPQAKKWMTRVCDLAARAGVKWTREEFHWNWIEPTRGEYDFTFFDQLVETANEHGISVYALCCYWTSWTQSCTDDGIEDYCRYLETLVRRYGDRIKHWEIWNEPNIFFWSCSREMYVRLLTRAYETIKSVDPDAQVLGCSTAGIDTGFIRFVMDNDGPFDALTVHPYRGVLDPQAFIGELRETRTLAGGRDVWITEMGWPSHVGGLSEREQANHVARTYISALASGAARSVAWYDFREDGFDPYYNEHHFGLIRNDLVPKIGYRALAAVGRLISTATHQADLDLGDGVIGFRFRDGDRRIVALWSTDRTRLASLDTGGVDVRIVNLIGEPAYQAEDRGRHTIVLERDMPVYVLADQPFDLRCSESLFRIRPNRSRVHAGERVQWDLAGMDAMTRVSIRSTPPGWKPFDESTQSPYRDLVVPDNATPGRYSVSFSVRTMGGSEFVLPVDIEVVPALIRG